MKKDIFKILLLTVLGFFVAIIGYPVLHELGHILASMVAGAKVMDLTLLPIPGVLCDVTGVSNTGLVLIGFGGTVFPLAFSLVIPRRWFVGWYIRVSIQGMSSLALGISLVSVICGINPQDDMIQVLNFWQYSKALILVILAVLLFAIVAVIAADKPLRRVCKYFEI